MQKHIVVIEDDEYVLLGLRLNLKSAGYEVSAFGDAEGAYLKISEVIASGGRIDLLVTDIDLPKISGIELLDSLTAKNIHIPIIAISGYGRKNIMEDLIGRKIFNFIEKPFTFKQLKDHIDFVFEKEEQEIIK